MYLNKRGQVMTYKVYHLITLILLRLAGVSIVALGLGIKTLGAEPAICWAIIGWGISVLLISLAFIGFTVSTSEITCPDGGEKIVAKVKLGLGSGHLYFSREKV
jgi:hypothetical protein